VFGIIDRIYTNTGFRRDNGNIFICAKMRQGSRFVCLMKTSPERGFSFIQTRRRAMEIFSAGKNRDVSFVKKKTPPERGFRSGWCARVNSIRDRRNSGTDFDVF
jgi:hypothetical protein